MNIVIGLFGMMCSGKDTIADYLVSKGYKKISISEHVLKPILNKIGVKPSRINYIKLGKSLKQFKPEALAFLTHGLMNKGDNLRYVIPNIMTFSEALFFKNQNDINFKLIKVSANQLIRFNRNLLRKSEKDVNDLALFKRLDITNLTQTGLKELMHSDLSDAEIINEESIESLKNKVDELLIKWGL